MKKEMIMGNQAIALGAMVSGVNLVTGYPGTPSTEVLESIAKYSKGNIYVEWSVNEKVALEVAVGAAYSGAKTMVTMKQVGLNVASDPLMSLSYIGIKGAMVIVCADDPGPISSQTEQDTRNFAEFAKIPVFDPSSVEEAYYMIQDAFMYSEKYSTPVLFRPTTRICHSYSSLEYEDNYIVEEASGFQRDTSKWVIFPKTSYSNHIRILKRNNDMAEELSKYRFNFIEGKGNAHKGIVTSGVSYCYLKETMSKISQGQYSPLIMKISTTYPFPENLALNFLKSLKEVMVLEELDPIIEGELLKICGKYNLNVKIRGKLTNDISNAGENNVDDIKRIVYKYLALENADGYLMDDCSATAKAIVRPPVLCAGCPHRASFYAIKKALKGKPAVFNGDIGCYTLGNAAPLNMVDTCLCMGAGITIAQGIARTNPDTINFAFVGDSTFFASGITGVVNAVYNKADIVLVVLDNSTTAMTGHQPNPSTGINVFGEVSNYISIKKVLQGIGINTVLEVDPLNLEQSVKAVNSVVNEKGVRAIIFKSPCIGISKNKKRIKVNKDKCTGCYKCINELGCPAMSMLEGKIDIDYNLCTACNLCGQVCNFNVIEGSDE